MKTTLMATLVVVLTAMPAASVALPAFHAPALPEGEFLSAHKQVESLGTPTAPDLVYGGGPLLLQPKVYITYWGFTAPPAISDPDGAEAYLKAFFQGVGGSSWANIQTQYADASGTHIGNPADQWGGSWHDPGPLPPPVDVGTFVAYAGTEAQSAVRHFGYDTNGFYLLILPHGYDTDFAGAYCAYHSAEMDDRGRVFAWSIVPYVSDFPTIPDPTGGPGAAIAGCGAGFIPNSPHPNLDAFSMTAGHEYEEAVTDKVPPKGWDASDGENADKCQFNWSVEGGYQEITLNGQPFGVQGMWSNSDHGCRVSYP